MELVNYVIYIPLFLDLDVGTAMTSNGIQKNLHSTIFRFRHITTYGSKTINEIYIPLFLDLDEL